MQLAARRGEIPANIESPGPEGEACRAAFGQVLYDLNVSQYCCGGLNFGYYYDRSPIIAYDGEAAPPYSMSEFVSATVPGCRIPHFWLRDGRSLYDALGNGLSLLRFDGTIDVAPLVASAKLRGIPLDVIDAVREDAGAAYSHGLVLVRPDQHVAWRGDEVPARADALLARLTGRALAPVTQ